MTKKTVHHIVSARKEAGLTQEAAAEQIPMSLRSLQRLERGDGDMTLGVLGRMTITYGKPRLPYLCCNAEAAALGIEPELLIQDGMTLDSAVLRFIDAIYDFTDRHKDRRMIRIASDGQITADEAEEWTGLRADLAAIITAAMNIQGVEYG